MKNLGYRAPDQHWSVLTLLYNYAVGVFTLTCISFTVAIMMETTFIHNVFFTFRLSVA